MTGSQGDRGLIGRDRELEVLGGLLDEAAAGESRFVAVSGEPGIGKTRLLAELAALAERAGMLPLEGSASEFESELAFGLVVDAFDAYLESLDPQAFERLATDRLGELAAVFPSLRELGAALEQPTTAAERFRVHNAVRELIERLAARQPVVLMLDDAHWADGASVELIAHLLRRMPQAAVMIVVAHRTGLADPMLAAAMNAAARQGDAAELELGPLDRAHSASLLRDGAGDPERLYRESGGNPFYLLELARADSGPAPTSAVAAGDVGAVPGAVAAAIGAELERLSPGARALAEGAAVAGDPFELDLAAAAAGLDDSAALACVDEVAARGLVRPAQVPRRFQFRHPLVRSAVYAACSPGGRLAAHERIATALAARGAPARARAAHVDQAARHGDAEAVAVLREAGLETAQQAPSSAVRWFSSALRLMPDEAPVGERLELLSALAAAQVAIGSHDGARAALLEGIDLLGEDHGMTWVGLTTACAGIEQLLGQQERANERLVEALEHLPDRASAEGVALLTALSTNGLYRGDFDAMRDWGASAVEAAELSGDESLRPRALASLAQGAAFAGNVEAALMSCDDAAGVIDGLSDEQLAECLDAIGALSAAELYLDRYEQAAGHGRRGIALARASGQGDMIPMLIPGHGTSAWVLGRTREAIETFDGAVDAARLSRNPQYLSWMLMNRSNVALMAGDLERARAAGEEAVALAREFDSGVISAWCGTILAAVLRQEGEPERAIELQLELSGGEDLTGIPGGWRAWALEILAGCRVEAGRVDAAERPVQAARAVADGTGLPLARLMADRAAATLALARGDFEDAAEGALSAARTADELGAKSDAAIARLLAGRILAAAGQTDRAIAELERAAELYDECEAERYRKQAEQELRKLGRRIHRPTRLGADDSGLDALTERELEVARLVVDRRTNKEIAAELFLSLKTVESHMRNIFRKLDVGSRVEVARAVEAAA